MDAMYREEAEHLGRTLKKLKEALSRADDWVRRYTDDYRDVQMYLAKNRSEIDSQEVYRSELSMMEIMETGSFEIELRDRIEKLIRSPYFARIDFRADDDTQSEIYYIGPFSFDDDNKVLIFDWRAPISSMFYESDVGRAAYRAPMGLIEGDLTRKRQYRISAGRLEYALESDLNIQDDVLQRELSQTADEKMKTIIATIQKEQNHIIRNETADTLIIQGVAGSGKTSIALHRVAYLMYRHQGRLTARNVAIISPNRIFADYISGVLPELGEEPIVELELPRIAARQLDGVMGFEPDKDPLETQDAAWAERVRFKSTADFLRAMDAYIAHATTAFFSPVDMVCGSLCARADWIEKHYQAYRGRPVRGRLLGVAEDIHDRFATDNVFEDRIPTLRSIQARLNRMYRMKDTLSLYRDFYSHIGRPDMLVLPDKKRLEWADVYPFLYMHAAFAGLDRDTAIHHLVVDEMQDYTPVQYAVLHRLFPGGKTILGDFGQRANPLGAATLGDFGAVFDRPEVVRLTTSYRSSFEIITFAQSISPDTGVMPVERHGERPNLYICDTPEGELAQIQKLNGAFVQGGNNTLGIVLRTQSEAESLADRLRPGFDIHLITPESEVFAGGVSVASVRMAKGLEFDEVIIPGATDEGYRSDTDRSLLYIAATRAMHKLSLTCAGEPSPLIDTAYSLRADAV